MDSEATDASTQQNPEQMDEEFTTTAYPNVQENLKLPTEDQVIIEEPVSKAVNEIVTNVVDWAMQAPFRACFRDLPIVDTKEILLQRMFEEKSYKAHEDHKNLYDALQKTPPGSPHSQPPPPPPPAGTSGAPGTSRASGSSQLPLHPPPSSTGTSGSAQQQGSKAPSSSKIVTSIYQSMAWTTFDTRYESTGFTATQETYPSDDLMQDDSILDEQVHLSDDDDSRNDHPPKDNLRKEYGNHFLKKTNQLLLNLLRPFRLPMCQMLRTTGLLHWYQPMSPQLRTNLEYLRYGSKGSSLALSISKMKAASYPDFDLELLVLEQIYQTHANLTKPGWDAKGYKFKHDYTIIESLRAVVFPVDNNKQKIMRFNKIYKFSNGTLTRILEALDYKVKEFKIKRLNPGMNTRLWTQKDVTRSKEFIAAIERRLKTRMIYRNLECFVGGRVRDIDYRILQRME
ncbi:hypothetical protein Tco_0019114 [Tanacetum coccineum]